MASMANPTPTNAVPNTSAPTSSGLLTPTQMAQMASHSNPANPTGAVGSSWDEFDKAVGGNTATQSTDETGANTAVIPAKPAVSATGEQNFGVADALKTIPNAAGDVLNLIKQGTYGIAKNVLYDIPKQAIGLVGDNNGDVGKSLMDTISAIPESTLKVLWGLVPNSAKNLANTDALSEIPSQFQDLAKSSGGYANAFINMVKAMPDSVTPAMQQYADQIDKARQSFENHPVNEALGYLGMKELATNPSTALDAVKSAKEFATSPIDSTISAAKDAIDISKPFVKLLVDKITGASSGIADSLEKSSLRLTPTQKTNLGSKLQDVVDYNTKNGITGNPEARYEKITKNYNQMEDTLQKTLDANSHITVPKDQVISQIEALKNNYANDRDVNAIERQIDDAVSVVKRQLDNIPLKNLNELKRSTYSGAYNKAGVKVLDTVEHDIGDVMRSNLNDTLTKNNVTVGGKSLNDFNKDYGTIINSRKLLKIAQGRPQLGLVGKLTSKVLGGIIGRAVGGGIPGEVAGILVAPNIAEHVAGTNVKTRIANLLKKK